MAGKKKVRRPDVEAKQKKREAFEEEYASELTDRAEEWRQNIEDAGFSAQEAAEIVRGLFKAEFEDAVAVAFQIEN